MGYVICIACGLVVGFLIGFLVYRNNSKKLKDTENGIVDVASKFKKE